MQVESLDNKQKRDMSPCLHCNKPCDAPALLCDECRSQLSKRNEASPISERHVDITDISTASYPVNFVLQKDQEQERAMTEHRIAPPSQASFDTPFPPMAPQTPFGSTHGVYVNMVEQAIHRLNDAARRIAAVEQSDKRQPHASRLSPLLDVSADIQRYSTPLPKAIANEEDTQQKRSEATGSNFPDLWPWLSDADEVDTNNTWENYTDPLLARRFPSSAEAARIEAEDERRAKIEGIIVTPSMRRMTRVAYLRVAFICLAILAILALTIDTALLSITFLHPHHTPVPVSGPPTLTITSPNNNNQASIGQRITLHLTHFNASTSVYITHDVGVPVLFNTGFPIVQVGKNGAGTASVVITAGDWGSGFHNIEAEDMTSHYTANATLQIINAGPSKPSHLIIKNLSLDMGSSYQGSNTIQPFVLSNDENASGAITWTASSDKPWLMLTPNQGTFSDSQKISIAVERGIMMAGSYEGTITFSSNVGAPIAVKVEMVVTLLPPNAGAVLMITPAVLSFTASDGTSSLSSQILTVANPGRHTLSWSLTNNQSSSNLPGGGTNWLNTNITSGSIVAGGTESVNVTANSQNLLPGTHAGTLVFSSPDPTTINSTQSVSISLTVQQHCSLTLSTGGMPFPGTQPHLRVGCPLHRQVV